MSNDEIKVGLRQSFDTSPGLKPQVIHTGNLKEQPILVKSKIEGMDEKLSNLNGADLLKKEKKIEIDKFKFHDILQECANDLLTSRKIKTNNGEEIIEILISYDPRNYTFTFGKSIESLNELFGLKLNDLADFLSNFLFTNINIYSLNKFEAIPELLPIVSMEAKNNNIVNVSVH